MILQALVEHYEDLLKQGADCKAGLGKSKSFLWTESGSAGTRTRVDPVEGGAGDGRQQEKNGFCCADDGSTSSGEEIRGGLPELFVRQCDLYSWC